MTLTGIIAASSCASVPMLGFRRFSNAVITIAGIELLLRIQKDQFNLSTLLLEGQTTSAAWNSVLAA